MKRLRLGLRLAGCASLAILILVPTSLANSGGEPARGIWCNIGAPLSLPNPDAGSVFNGVTQPQFVTIPPFWAVNVTVDQGKTLLASGLVSKAYFLPRIGSTWVGAFCPGDTHVTALLAGKSVTPVLGTDGKPVSVNNLGLSIPGDPGAIYTLVAASSL